MSDKSKPSDTALPVRVVVDDRPVEVVVISHSPLFYWWPVWAVGFLMAWLSYWNDERAAFVPAGTVAEQGAVVQGHDAPRDILIVPPGRSLPTVTGSTELQQPSLRIASSNNLGIIWAVTLCLVIVVTHVHLRGLWSMIVVSAIGFATVLLALLGLWDPLLRLLGIIDIHMNALGYLSISLFLFAIWLFTFLVLDRLKYMIFTRGRLRVRKAIGEGETIFDIRGMVVKRHRDDLFRHWLLGFGSADLTVHTSGTKSQQIEMPNVLFIDRKLALINTMLQELEVIKGR